MVAFLAMEGFLVLFIWACFLTSASIRSRHPCLCRFRVHGILERSRLTTGSITSLVDPTITIVLSLKMSCH